MGNLEANTRHMMLLVLLVTAAIGITEFLRPNIASSVQTMYGDADCSGGVDSVDALVELQYSAGLTASAPCLKNADVDGDSQVTALDATLILQLQAQLIDRLGPPPAQAAAIASGDRHTCALTTTGGVKCWGENVSGALGDGTTTEYAWPRDAVGLQSGVVAIAAGLDDTCVVTSAGGVKCWGYNDSGQLGDGSTTDRNSPVDVIGLTSGVISIAAGQSHSCVITTAHAVKCWGNNLYGQLGATTSEHCTSFNFPCSTTPLAVPGLDSGVAAISLGEFHSCALTMTGGVKCWGSNSDGQVGDGTLTNRATPVDVTGLSSAVAAIAVGALHSCALTTEGGVKCWGAGQAGQLGSKATQQCDLHTSQSIVCNTSPQDVGGLTSGAVAIAAGSLQTCALTTTGGVKCWGDDGYGELGAQTTERCDTVPCSTTPLDVNGLNAHVASITAGGFFNCAALTGGNVRCWGENDLHQLGTKSADHCGPPFPHSYACSFTPVDTLGFSNAAGE